MTTRGLKTEGSANTITFEKQINQTSVLKYRFIPTGENGDYYVGNINDDENDFRTFNVGGNIYADVSSSRWSQEIDTSPYFNHVISVEFSNSRCKWVDETDNVTILDQQQTFHDGDFTVQNCYIYGGNSWTFIDASLTTNGTLQFDLYADNTGLYDRVSSSYIQTDGWENVSVDADPQPTPTPTPTPSWQKQADWAQTDSTQVDYIKNKPTVGHVEWWGTQAEYDAILVKDPDIIYNIIYEEPQIEYFYVEDISGEENTLSIVKYNSSAPTIEVFKSTDQVNWESMGNTDTTAIEATIPVNGKLYLKAVTDRWTGNSYNYRNTIKCSGNHNVGGHIMSLLYGDNFENATFTNSNKWAFQRLFIQNTTLVNAEDLILPSNTIDYCYSRMFESCSNLITVPVLPAMVMTQSCYEGMFQYINTSFTPPALPATTLANGCYGLMFWSCKSFTTAPVLPATTLAERCYESMFRYSSVKSVTTYAQDISASGCLNDWLGGVSSTGDFYNLGGATYTTGASGIPDGWTEHTSL